MLLKIPQAAWELGISRSGLYALLKSGEIPSVLLGPQGRRIPRAELDAFVARRLGAVDADDTRADRRLTHSPRVPARRPTGHAHRAARLRRTSGFRGRDTPG
jgi:excisionase family DNA binding protein